MNTVLRYFLSIAILAGLPIASALAAYPSGKLYTMSNAVSGNEVLVYDRLNDGSLLQTGHVPTYGKGTGGGLGNQGAVTLSREGSALYVVNAGDNSISSFHIRRNWLDLTDTEASGGIRPVSITEDRGRVFVLNAGDGSHPGNIQGFFVKRDGGLKPIPNATRLLSDAAKTTGAAQIQFSHNGRQLIVTEKATNLILTYPLYYNNIPGTPKLNASSGITPFGFAVGSRKQIFVSNAEAGASGKSSLSSYKLLSQGTLQNISPRVTTGETAACWVTLTPDGRYAFTTNTGSGTLSSFKIDFDGKTVVAESKAGITGADTAPIDMAISPESRFLYTLNSGNKTISSFAVGWEGKLTPLKTLSGLPDGANGLAVR